MDSVLIGCWDCITNAPIILIVFLSLNSIEINVQWKAAKNSFSGIQKNVCIENVFIDSILSAIKNLLSTFSHTSMTLTKKSIYIIKLFTLEKVCYPLCICNKEWNDIIMS